MYGNMLDMPVPRKRGIDIIVFPEFFSTGFHPGFEDFENTEDGVSLSWMKRISVIYDAAVCGSVPVSDGNGKYNRFYFVYGEKVISSYDKRHIFLGAEAEAFSPGNRRVIVDFRGMRFLLQLCFDLRFPVWSRVVDGDYDAVLNIAQWPGSRVGAAELLVRARAVENQCYYIFCNSASEIAGEQEGGRSHAVSPYGDLLVPEEYSTGSGRMLLFDIDVQLVRKSRKTFKVWASSDRFELIY